MYVGQILTADSANGPGIRISVFVSGCTNCCKGCFQPQTWDFEYGRKYDSAMEQFIMDELAKDYYQGITILGGEPFEIQNQPRVAGLVRRVREELPQKDIWMYTGFSYDVDLQPGGCRYTDETDGILDRIDVLVDGRFVEELKNIQLRFRGSKNQRILDMKATRESGKLVLAEEFMHGQE